jgi:hypothetical protein
MRASSDERRGSGGPASPLFAALGGPRGSGLKLVPAPLPPPARSSEDDAPLPPSPPAPAEEDSEAKRLRLRRKAFKELVSTEISYVASLHLLMEVYYTPLAESGVAKGLLSKVMLALTPAHASTRAKRSRMLARGRTSSHWSSPT